MGNGDKLMTNPRPGPKGVVSPPSVVTNVHRYHIFKFLGLGIVFTILVCASCHTSIESENDLN